MRIISKIKVFSPGRVNIIGEHTDHQGGYVLPGCIQYGITLQGMGREDGKIKVSSEEMKENYVLDPRNLIKKNNWVDYVQGSILYFIQETAVLPSIEITINSTLPVGSGLSSSAALEVGILFLLDQFYNTCLSRKKIAELAWLAETKFVGVSCGIMDQSIIARSITDNAYIINCQTLEIEVVEIPSDLIFLLVDTKVRRSLSSSKYNERIEELNLVKERLAEMDLDLAKLQEMNGADRMKILDDLSQIYPIEIKRLSHVLSENYRVLRYKHLLKSHNLREAGKLLIESHQSLRDNYEASWSEADEIIDWVKKNQDLVQGGRMVGAGWGGNVILQAVVSNKDQIIEAITDRFDWIDHNQITFLSIRGGTELL